MGAGTSTATFSRSLGGSVGVAALGAVMNNKLSSGLGGSGGGGVSLNSDMSKLPPQVKRAIEHAFVDALHPVFLVAAIVAFAGFVIALALPDRPLAGPAADPTHLDQETDEEAALEMEAKAAVF
jgi:hypothetical protein